MATPVLQIDVPYLKSLLGTMELLLDYVDIQIKGLGYGGGDAGAVYIPPVSSALSVPAGGVVGSNGGDSFGIAGALNNALSTAGGSIMDDLEWYRNLFKSMINDINSTINSFGSTESLNSESVQTLLQDFSTFYNQLESPPSSGGSGSGSGSGGSGSGGSGSGGSGSGGSGSGSGSGSGG